MLNKNFDIYQLNKKSLSQEEVITLDLIKQNSRVLEIGCNAGKLSKELKQQKNAFVVGVDFDYRLLQIAKKNMDSFILGNIEDEKCLSECEKYGQFDYILLLHIIEHLIDPWTLLTKIKSLLKENGTIICATPNIANWNSRALLFFKGRWEYQNVGVMDKTHLRFFTKKTLIEAFINAGFQIEKLHFLHPNIPIIDNVKMLWKYRDYFSTVTKKILPSTLWSSVLMIVARLEKK